ncbi:MAG: lysophospholipid acyltransferase family protein [Thermoguttaceae bacterium]
MKISSPVLLGLAGLLASRLIRAWMGTLHYRTVYYDPTVDPAFPECRGHKIFIFWHEYMLLPIYQRAGCKTAILLSRHRDAEIILHLARYAGFDFVRGSTRRGGVAAIRQLLRKSTQMHLAITPDGPRGPRRRMAPGPIYLASRLGMPLVPVGIGYDRPWRIASAWDQFAIPRPFSRARAILGPPLFVPPDLDRSGMEEFRRRFEALQNRLSDEAEAWAESGSMRIGQMRIRPGPHQSIQECIDRLALRSLGSQNADVAFGGQSHAA